MSSGIPWLVLANLRSSWFQAVAAVVLTGAGIIGVAYFTAEARRTQSQIRAVYQEEGASGFVVEAAGFSYEEMDRVVAAVRQLPDVESADAPYNGLELGIQADVSFLVFENARQKEYLGARLTVLGIAPPIKTKSRYYIDFHWVNPSAPRAALGIPLLPAAGEFRLPQAGEMLLPSTVTDYVGVQPGAQATVELVDVNSDPPVVHRLENVRLIGTFDVAGPDRGRIDPFWQLLYGGESLLTARGTTGTEPTTLPVIVNAPAVQDFLRIVAARSQSSPTALRPRQQLVISATSLAKVPAVENRVIALLETKGLRSAGETDGPGTHTYRILIPERNNFMTAEQEQRKIGTGGAYFAGLLLVLLAFATGGLQVLATLTRWRDYGILQSTGFSPGKILMIYGAQLLVVLIGAVLFAGLVCLLSPQFAVSRGTFAIAAGLAIGVTVAASVPALLWPMRVTPSDMLKELQ